ncbi:hypothetical protein GCM10011312_04950 [Planktosalinus lacus]|uniref:Menorin-like domain-containing protein n=2 Tax=Planktosalinus lacus TaxID=1526573 RepID=A0A8J2V7G0_9FLAO|nr:hypothetical protein GCM10011312_04950 [Planktosalinus lacus]
MTTGSLTKIMAILVIIIATLYVYHRIPFKFDYMGYTEKIWAHRVNSLEKLNYTQKHYAGIELDVVYDLKTNTFDVNHPPAKSIGLTLDTYFSSLNEKNNIGIWLDFKNLNEENEQESLIKLKELIKKHELIPQYMIVESQSPEYLFGFKQEGFKTSFYLPSSLNRLSNEELIAKVLEIKTKIKNYPTNAISTNSVDYSIIAKHFPNEKKYLWNIDGLYNTRIFKNFFLNRKVLKDPKVEVLLVRVTRGIGNR